MDVNNQIQLFFVDEPVVYTMTDRRQKKPVRLQFLINSTDTVTLLAYPNAKGTVAVNIADILWPYTERLEISQQPTEVVGGCVFQLKAIDDNPISGDYHLGIRGRLGKFYGADTLDIISLLDSKNQALMLTPRAEGKGATYYRSELAMSAIYFLKPNYCSVRMVLDGEKTVDEIIGLKTYISAFNGATMARVERGGKKYRFGVVTVSNDDFEDIAQYYINIADDPIADETYMFRFINSYGVWEYMLIASEARYVPEVEDTEVYEYETAAFQRVKQLQRRDITEKITLSSGHLDSARLRLIKDLLQSDQVEMLIDDVWCKCKTTAKIDLALVRRTAESIPLEVELLQNDKNSDSILLKGRIEELNFLRDHKNNIIFDHNNQPITT